MTLRHGPVRALLITLCLALAFVSFAGCGDNSHGGAQRSTAPLTTSESASAEPSSGSSESAGPLQFRVVALSEYGTPAGSSPPADAQSEYDSVTCPGASVSHPPEAWLVACDGEEIKYLLEPAVIVGGVSTATALIPENSVNWAVSIELDPKAAAAFIDLSNALVGTGQQFAIVLDGSVLSAPTMDALIVDGHLQISGNFDEAAAKDLAEQVQQGG